MSRSESKPTRDIPADSRVRMQDIERIGNELLMIMRSHGNNSWEADRIEQQLYGYCAQYAYEFKVPK